MRILVADDNAEVCDAICEILSNSGMAAEAALTFWKASRLLTTQTWDALLAGFHFPDEPTGLDLALKAARRGIGAAIMSGSPEVRLQVEPHGIPFLAKPFRGGQLLAILRKLQTSPAPSGYSSGYWASTGRPGRMNRP